MLHFGLLAGLILPLALDTFAVAAALGIAGFPVDRRLRLTVILAAFEGGMPIVGALVGAAAGRVIGGVAGWTAILVLIVAGASMVRPGDDDADERTIRLLRHAHGWALLDLGVAISVDELAVGVSLGLLGISLLAAVVWIAAQAFVAAQTGIRIGARLGDALRERAEGLAGAALILTGVVLLILKVKGVAL